MNPYIDSELVTIIKTNIKATAPVPSKKILLTLVGVFSSSSCQYASLDLRQTLQIHFKKAIALVNLFNKFSHNFQGSSTYLALRTSARTTVSSSSV